MSDGRGRRRKPRLIDRAMRVLLNAGIGTRGTALLETIGRTSREPRVTPVTNGLDADAGVFWIVTEHGHATGYVRNIEANPHVRVRVGRTWHAGTARVMAADEPDGDPQAVMARIAATNPHARANLGIVARAGAEHVVVRIDLDQTAPAG